MDLDANRRLIAAALARIPDGDRDALQTVYRLASAKLFGVCLRILGERSEAEDVLQDIFITIWRKAGDFDPGRASPMTWLIAIARNRAIDRLRAGKNSRTMDPIDEAFEIADDAPGADTLMERGEDNAKLHGCLDTLADDERTALGGAFFDGNTYEELAARLAIPLGTIKSRIRRAMMKLKTCLET
jgi:RNA polymerase sigma-70 factor (ECF subfamily)